MADQLLTYATVRYHEAYPGIDLAYYGNQGKLEYDFIVAPGADPDQIRLAFEGTSDIQVAEGGDLLLTTALGEVTMQKPIVYQLEPDGHKTLVAGSYIVERNADALSGTQYSVLSSQSSALPLSPPSVLSPQSSDLSPSPSLHPARGL